MFNYNTQDMQKISEALAHYQIGLYCKYINDQKKYLYLQNNQNATHKDKYISILKCQEDCLTFTSNQKQLLIDLLDPLVNQVLNTSYPNSNFRSDLYQEGIVGILFAIDMCTCNNGFLNTYFYDQIEHAIQGFLNLNDYSL